MCFVEDVIEQGHQTGKVDGKRSRKKKNERINDGKFLMKRQLRQISSSVGS